ncbi:MAG TPA: hypothetical protein EYG85_07080 [Crocinitomix sp.]|nr:hypothetical protein [Crocinitomix sp.]
MYHLKSIFVLFFVLTFSVAKSQSIEGYVLDENSNPIPYTKVWIKNYSNLGTITNIEGYYKIVLTTPLNYEVVFSALGYSEETYDVIVKGVETVRQDVYLHEKVTQLQTVEIREKKKNLGYEIVKRVIAKKSELARPVNGYTCEVYIKGTETFDYKNKKQKIESDDQNSQNKMPVDSFEEDEKKSKEQELKSRLNMIETSVLVNFQFPNKLKEIKTAQYKLGRPNQIYLMHSPVTVDAYFNFYEGLLIKERLHDTPIVSPLHVSGILSYKYKLKEIITQGQDTIYRVHITPRSVGTSTLEGNLFIKKHEWVLTKVDLSMHKGNLRTYDDFRIIQEYEKIDSVWLVSKQTFIYKTKYGKEIVKGQTEVVYSNYVLNPKFPAKYFNNEVGITKDDAYKKDSVYWDKIRPVKLTKEEQRKKFVQDSIKVAHSKKEYLDSLDAAYNEITFAKVAWWGVTYRNRAKKTQWRFPSAVSIIKPISIAGPRIGFDVNYFKKFENNQWVNVYTSSSIGVLNQDYRGWVNIRHFYNPKKLASYAILFDHDIRIINGNVPYLDYIDPSNYFFIDRVQLTHSFELFNGFYVYANGVFGRRKSLSNLEFYNWNGDELQTQPPVYFDPYNVLRTDFSLSYTPGQKYLTEPNRKVVLGSRWPTFSVTHKKGWNILGSSIDFDFVKFNINQSFNIGTVGRSRFVFEIGKYVNQDSVYFLDQKFFRQADVGWTSIFMSNPMNSFQNLQSSYNTRDFYYELHYTHNFNGAIINKIPFMKKTGIRTVTGGGVLFIPEYGNLFYQEAFFGIERRFKFLRQRIRVGGFVIFSDSNYQPPKIQFKIRFDVESDDDIKYNF